MSDLMKPAIPIVDGTRLSMESVEGATLYKIYSVRIEPEQGTTTLAKIVDNVLYIYNRGGGSSE